MEYLLNPRNIRILESFCLVKTLFAFDYDGTLAPIVNNPDKAVMNSKVSDYLKELNQLSSVAIITGRKASDVKKLLPFDPFIVIGNHGAEGSQSKIELDEMTWCCQRWLAHLKDSNLLPVLNSLGIVIEDKVFSLSFHFRNAVDPIAAEKSLEHILMNMADARVTKGKFVLNLIPEHSMDKGMALDRIMKDHQFRFCVYFGDDYTDEDVFRFKSPRLLTVKVGTEESLAKFYLKNQNEMEEVLQIIKTFMHNQKVSLI